MAQVTILDSVVTTVHEAARQLRIPPATLMHWLEGGERRGRRYEPILREHATGRPEMTWGEIVEAQYLRTYRSEKKVPMQRLRPFISGLRSALGIPYPLAHFRPWVSENRQLLLDSQETTDLPDSLWAVFRGKHGQLVINPLIEVEFLERVEFAHEPSGEALALWPMGMKHPVTLDPRISSAAATVKGVRTGILTERIEALESFEDVADEFGLSVAEVKAAVSFELHAA
ncbi:MAG: hypothetical protein Q8P38_12065 [Candidatus Nanopelagicales bacterium]|nr:hypothetical protein [Candidatus Nanopelagicales bacterium]